MTPCSISLIHRRQRPDSFNLQMYHRPWDLEQSKTLSALSSAPLTKRQAFLKELAERLSNRALAGYSLAPSALQKVQEITEWSL